MWICSLRFHSTASPVVFEPELLSVLLLTSAYFRVHVDNLNCSTETR